MADEIVQTIEESKQYTVQEIARSERGGGVFLVNWLARSGSALPSWWSVNRDNALRAFWKKSDHLSGALYTMQSKMTAIPVTVVARDLSDKKAVKDAVVLTEILNDSPGFGRGWVAEYGKWVEDLLGTDNGAFMEVIGRGRKDGPIVGTPISLAHLDSVNCVRTGHSIYPVIYTDPTSGKRYKLHYSRVIESSQMTSPISYMNGVGYCAISRCIMVSQTLIDILVFKQEKLGSRPHRQIIITQGGLDPQDIASAFETAEQTMDSMGLSRYSKMVVGGSGALPDADIKVVELSSMPDGFDETTSVMYGMATIALAFGTDARELFPAITAGATRADALLQHLKQRGKGPGQILQVTERGLNFKFVPSRMKAQFDFQDDAQDRQASEIKMVRANSRVQDMSSGVTDQRTLREQMFEAGDITVEQFEKMELESGRLPDGTDVKSLFFKKGREFRQYLDMGVENPLDVMNNDPIAMNDAIVDKKAAVMETLANTTDVQERWVALQANSALMQLELMYVPPAPVVDGQEDGKTSISMASNGKTGAAEPRQSGDYNKTAPGHGYVDPRLRKIDLTSPSSADSSLSSALE